MRFPRNRTALAGLGVAALTAALSVTATPGAGATESAKLPPPPECATGCERVFELSLPHDVHFAGWRDNSVPGGDSVLVYYSGGSVHDTLELDNRRVQDADCGWEGDAQRCAVTYHTGAHGSGALSALLLGDAGIVRSDDVLGNSPGATLRQLDDNGRPDVAIRQSTYEPNYAQAPQYWETYLEFEGEFVRTGCTAPEQGNSPAPTEPVHTSCAYV